MTIRYKETAWKSLCFEKPIFWDILAKFGHFSVADSGLALNSPLSMSATQVECNPLGYLELALANTVISAYSQVSTTIRYKDTAWKRMMNR